MTEKYAVYIASAANTLKIGFTADLAQRAASLQNCCPVPIRLEFAAFSAESRALEFGVHLTLDRYRIHGEWFTIDLVTAIEAIRQSARQLQLTIRDYTADEMAVVNDRYRKVIEARPRFPHGRKNFLKLLGKAPTTPEGVAA